MIYLDHGATSMPKPPRVGMAMMRALRCCANPGRGGYAASMAASETVYRCRETAGKLFSCQPEQVAFTSSCTHGLNIAIHTLVKPGSRVVISGFEHNAVTRPLHRMGARVTVAGRTLFDWEDTLEAFENALESGADAAVFTHVSNVFGYILPVEEMAKLCRQYHVPFIVDAAQSAGMIPVDFSSWQADFVAMPGHKGLLGPQGTGILLCGRLPEPLLCGGTGSVSLQQEMPDFLPDRIEAGTLNVPGIAGMDGGMRYLLDTGTDALFSRQVRQRTRCAQGLKKMGFSVFEGPHQGGTLSFLPGMDCQQAADFFARKGIALRAGLHCAPLAHESAGTKETGTLRVSFGHDAHQAQTAAFLKIAAGLTEST